MNKKEYQNRLEAKNEASKRAPIILNFLTKLQGYSHGQHSFLQILRSTKDTSSVHVKQSSHFHFYVVARPLVVCKYFQV